MARSATTSFSAYPVSGRSIIKSADPLSYNQTYSSHRPVLGLPPLRRGRGPDVLWAEGTAQVRFMQRALGMIDLERSTTTISAWNARQLEGRPGPLGADRTDTGHEVNEYHVWPTSAAASWTLLGTGGTAPRRSATSQPTAGPSPASDSVRSSRLASLSGSRLSAISDAMIPIVKATNTTTSVITGPTL